MTDAQPSPPSRRAVWIVRLVFYPVALGLIALAWHQRHARAAGEEGEGRPVTWALLTGTTQQGMPASGRHGDGRPDWVAFPIQYRCDQDVGRSVWVLFQKRPQVDRDGRVRLHDRDDSWTWDSGWTGTTTVDLDGHYDDRGLTGMVSAQLELDANGVHTTCRADDFRLDLRTAPGRAGTTSQDEPVAVDVARGRVRAFSAGLKLTCTDHWRHVVWSPEIDRVDGGDFWQSVRVWAGGTNEILLVGAAQNDATGTFQASLTGLTGDKLSGTVQGTIKLWQDGPSCATPPDGVPFTIDR